MHAKPFRSKKSCKSINCHDINCILDNYNLDALGLLVKNKYEVKQGFLSARTLSSWYLNVSSCILIFLMYLNGGLYG